MKADLPLRAVLEINGTVDGGGKSEEIKIIT